MVCLIAGALARRSGRFPETMPVVLSRTVIDVALPALTLRAIHGLDLGRQSAASLAVALLAPWAILLIALVVLWPVARGLGWSREVLAALLLTAGFANTSFVGFPLVEALWGSDGLSTAVWVDQGEFLVLCTAGVLIAASASGGARPTLASVAKRLVLFPPFIAFALALVLHPLRFPAALDQMLAKLAALVVPLALLSVGWQLRLDLGALAAEGSRLAIGLGLRLVVAPAVVAVVLLAGLGHGGRAAHVTIAEAAMAPMITSALLAVESNLAPRLASLMVGVGVPLSLVSVPIWAWLLGRLGP